MIVVDTNIIAFLYLQSEHAAHSEALLGQDPDWAVPILWRSEFRSVLAGYMRRGTLAWETAAEIMAEAEDLLSGSEFEVDSRRVLELVRDSDCSAYDCEFVALAERLDTRLVTMDKKILKAFPRRAASLVAS